MSLPFIRKYQPEKSTEIVGQDLGIKETKDYILNYKKQKSKCAFLFGPSGVGKTITVHALGKENNFEIIEVNASDFRNKAKINETVGNALKQGSLFGLQKLILIDEVDGLSGTKDRGAAVEINSLIKKSKYPVVITAQNPFEQKLATLRKSSKLIAFKELDYNSIFTVLEKICKNEKINYEERLLKSLARSAGGDLRSAINDLDGIAADKKQITREDIMDLAQRDKEESMPSALVKILKNSSAAVALGAFDNVKEDFDQRFLWLDKNMPREYENAEDRNKAYYYMARADVFKNRIRRWQHWRFLVYVNAFLTAGIATSKKQKYTKFLKYEPTGRILKMFWAKQKSFKKKSISEKIAKKTHSSTKYVLQNFELYKKIIKSDIPTYTNEFDLVKEEIAWLKK